MAEDYREEVDREYNADVIASRLDNNFNGSNNLIEGGPTPGRGEECPFLEEVFGSGECLGKTVMCCEHITEIMNNNQINSTSNGITNRITESAVRITGGGCDWGREANGNGGNGRDCRPLVADVVWDLTASDIFTYFGVQHQYNSNNITFSDVLFFQLFLPGDVVPTEAYACNTCLSEGPNDPGIYLAYLSHLTLTITGNESGYDSTWPSPGTSDFYSWQDLVDLEDSYPNWEPEGEILPTPVVVAQECCEVIDDCCESGGCTDDTVGFFADVDGNDRFGNPCISPCTDTDGNPSGFAANNFNVNIPSVCDDGSCAYPDLIPGCMDEEKCGYDPLATIDDGSCCDSGCLNWQSSNYDTTACCSCEECCDPPGTTPCVVGIGAIVYPIDGEGWQSVVQAAFPPFQVGWSNIDQNLGGITNHQTLYPGAMGANTNWFRISEQEVLNKCPDLAVGCIVISEHFLDPTANPPQTVPSAVITAMSIGNDEWYDVFVSKRFFEAPSNTTSDLNSISIVTNCGACNEYPVILEELGDADPGQSDGDNGYISSTEYLGYYLNPNVQNAPQSHYAGQIIDQHAFIILEPDPAVSTGPLPIRASDFVIDNPNGPINTNVSPGIVPTFYGGSIHPRIGHIRFEDEDNAVYTDYSIPEGQGLNSNYDSNWTPTTSNKVRVIVEILPTPMPTNALNLTVDIDKISNQTNARISSITILD